MQTAEGLFITKRVIILSQLGMKVVAVLLALVAVSVADICNDVAGGRAQATQIKSVIATGLDTVMG